MPAVRFFEPQLNVFWVYGPFCSAPCSFGYIAEHEASSSSKQLSLTSFVMRTYFKVHDIQIAPPRAAHQRYGGPLNDLQFRGIPERGVLDVVYPPFVSYSHYVLAVQDPARSSDPKTILTSSTAAGKLIDLSRPKVRDFGRLEKKTTLRAPMLLNFLAERGTSVVPDVVATKTTEENLIEERRSRVPKTPAGPAATEQRGFLSRYMKK